MIGSIILSQNPVTYWERYMLVAVAENEWGISDAVFTAYRNSEQAQGGFWSCSFQLHARETILKDLFERGLGRHVEVWGDGLQQDFEGYIHELVYNLPPDQFVVTLEDMTNRMRLRSDYDNDGITERTTLQEDADSQAQFGIKELIVSGGDVASQTVANQAAASFLALRSFPRPEARIGGASGSRPFMEVFCRGYISTLEWRLYNQTAIKLTQAASLQLGLILDASAPFIKSRDIDANGTEVAQFADSDRTALDLCQGIANLGDANSNRWLFYVTGKTAVEAVGQRAVFTMAVPPVVT